MSLHVIAQSATNHKWLALVVTLLAITWLTGAPSNHATAQVARPQATVESLKADEWALLAEQIMNEPGPLREDQLQRAGIALDQALDLLADDPELWRSRAVLHQRLGQPQQALAALEHYARLRDEDDAAWLQIALLRLQEHQTLDSRLDAIEQMLDDDQADQLPASVRSRLASRAAAMAREIGDQQRFGEYLTRAVRLDQTNPDAAELTYQLALDRQAQPTQMGRAAIGYVRAAPADPRSRLELGRILLE